MLRIVKIRVLLENHRQIYSAEILEQIIFQSFLFVYSNIYLTGLSVIHAKGEK